MQCYGLLLLLAVICVIKAFDPTDDLPANWIDPNDPSAGLRLVSPPEESLTCARNTPCVSISDDPSLRHILRRAFQLLRVDPLQRSYFSRSAKLTLSSYNMAIIADYLESTDNSNELAEREKVRSALHDMIELIEDDDSYSSFLTTFNSVVTPWLPMAAIVILTPATFFVLRNMYSVRVIWAMLILSVFALSYVRTYSQMYQEKQAERLAAAEELRSAACAPPGLFEQMFDSVSSLVSFSKKSRCQKYLEKHTIDIVNEISPFEVFARALSTGIFSWLPVLCGILNESLRRLCEGLPIQAQVFMFVMVALLVIRISTPFFTIDSPIMSLVGNGVHQVFTFAVGHEAQPPPPSQPHHLQGTASAPLMQATRHALETPHRSKKRRIEGSPLRSLPAPNDSSPRKDDFVHVTKRTPERQRNMQRRLRAEAEEGSTVAESPSSDFDSDSRSRSSSPARTLLFRADR